MQAISQNTISSFVLGVTLKCGLIPLKNEWLITHLVELNGDLVTQYEVVS